MKLIDRDDLKRALFAIAENLEEPSDCILVGGAALLILTENASATKDIDVLPSENFSHFVQAVQNAREQIGYVDINTRSQAFESNLPDEWESRLVHADNFSRGHLNVFTPAPEDIAVMKIFRFAAKDASDIASLSKINTFDPSVFFVRFVEVLKIAIGEPRWHAQSFCMIWNSLYPTEQLEIDEVLKAAGL